MRSVYVPTKMKVTTTLLHVVVADFIVDALLAIRLFLDVDLEIKFIVGSTTVKPMRMLLLRSFTRHHYPARAQQCCRTL